MICLALQIILHGGIRVTNLFTGLLIGSLVKKYGSRSVSLFGSMMTAIGFLLASFLLSVPYLYIVYGIIGGWYNSITLLRHFNVTI